MENPHCPQHAPATHRPLLTGCTGATRSFWFSLLLGSLLSLGGETVRAQSTIDATLNEGWGANIGWTNWLPSTANGAVVGEYVCSGYVYGANVGWINLGSGSPANKIQYGNAAAGDFGVNYYPTTTPGVAILRGYAYGANIGWINFEGVGNPSVNLLNGQLYGYAYSANCGWINLGTNTAYVVKTDSITPGVDTDGDGIADAFELLYFGNLTTANAGSDYNGDGVSDLQAYLDGTDPRSVSGSLKITQFFRTGGSGNNIMTSLTFNSSASRLYRIETTPSLINPTWADVGLGIFAPDSNTTTTRQLAGTSSVQFFRVRAFRLGF